jgi:hypothetical protein
MNGICAGFADPPKMCKRILESSINDPTILFYPEDQEVYEVHHVFIVCLLIMVTVSIVLCLYRRHAKREMKQKINVQIEDAVNQYLALSNKDPEAQSRADNSMSVN